MAANSGTWTGSANGHRLTVTISRLATAKNAATSTSGKPTIQSTSFMGSRLSRKPRPGQSIAAAGPCRRSVGSGFGVELLAQLLAGLEERHRLFGDLYGLTGAGI